MISPFRYIIQLVGWACLLARPVNCSCQVFVVVMETIREDSFDWGRYLLEMGSQV